MEIDGGDQPARQTSERYLPLDRYAGAARAYRHERVDAGVREVVPFYAEVGTAIAF